MLVGGANDNVKVGGVVLLLGRSYENKLARVTSQIQ